MIKDDVSDEHWWPQGGDHCKNLKPKFSTNTTQRSSFSTISIENVANRPRGRHGSNPHVTPSTGISKLVYTVNSSSNLFLKFLSTMEELKLKKLLLIWISKKIKF